MNSNSVSFKIAAAAFAATGIIAILYWLVHPLAGDGPSMVRDEAYWTLRAGDWAKNANLLLFVFMMVSLVGCFTLAPLMRERAQPLDALSLVPAVPGHMLLAAAGIFNAYVATALSADPATRNLLALSGPLLGGPLHGAFGLGGLLFYGGYLCLAASLKRARLIGWPTTLAFVPAAAAVSLHPMLPPLVRLIGFAIFGLACLRVAVACWRRANSDGA